jgi:Peptidase M15
VCELGFFNMTRKFLNARGALAGALAVLVWSGPAVAQDAWFDIILKAGAAKAAAETERSAQPLRKVVRTARLARSKAGDAANAPRRSAASESTSNSLTGNAITWQASSNCVPSALRGVLNDVVANFGPVIVTSTCRGAAQNRAAGGAGNSYHLHGEAVDFRVRSGGSGMMAYLASNSSVGGLKHYGGGLYHIDTGPRRSW